MTSSFAPNPSTAQARVIADELARCGVTDAVLAPGSRSAALAIAMHEMPSIRLHVEIDERSAGFCALGLGRATARPAPVVVTSGTAVANLLPAVVEADLAGVPWLVLAADRPAELRDTGANQTIDQTQLFGNAVRWFVDLGVAEDRPGAVAYWRSVIARATAEARGVRAAPGPVHVNVPFREPTVPVSDDGRSRAAQFSHALEGRPGGRAWTHVSRSPRSVPADGLASVAEQVRASTRGLIVVGESDVEADPVNELAHAAGFPVVAEPLSPVRADRASGDDAVISTAHWLAAHPPFAAEHRPDLVLRVGRAGLSRPLTVLLDDAIPHVLVDADGRWLDPDRSVGDLVVAEPGALCAAVAHQLTGDDAREQRRDWMQSWRTADRVARAALDTLLASDDAPSEPRTARDTAAAVPDGGTLVVASSMPVRDLDMVMRPRTGLRVLGNRGASGIDGFVSTALGVALGAGGPTVALAGDLSLLHDRNGFLLTPDGEAADCTFVICQNDGGGIFNLLPPATHAPGFERLFGTPHGMDVGDVARSHGLEHTVIDRAHELPDAIGESCATGGVRLLEVRTDRVEQAALRTRMRAVTGEALDAAPR